MNKFSGYSLFKLSGGQEIEVKFSNGTYEIFGQLMGIDSIEEIDASLAMPTKKGLDENGKEVDVPYVTLSFMKAFKLYFLAAVKYAALAQNKSEVAGVPVQEINEWNASEWMEEIGIDKITAVIPKPEAETKKKPKEVLRPTQ